MEFISVIKLFNTFLIYNIILISYTYIIKKKF